MTPWMESDTIDEHGATGPVPSKGDRVERVRPGTGLAVRGTVFHVDRFQILVKWDDGRSASLRPGETFRIVDEEYSPADGGS